MDKTNLYNDDVIQACIFTDKENDSLKYIGIKYLTPKNHKDKTGQLSPATNIMGGETDWFILPHSFGTVVGKKLFEQYSAGLSGFDKNGIDKLKDWLIEFEIIDDAMCY